MSYTHDFVCSFSDNPYLNCSKLKNTLDSRPEIIFVNENTTSCMTSKIDYGWFPTETALPFSQVKAMHDVGLIQIQPNINK